MSSSSKSILLLGVNVHTHAEGEGKLGGGGEEGENVEDCYCSPNNPKFVAKTLNYVIEFKLR